MDDDSILTVVDSIFRFCGGRYINLPVKDDLKRDIKKLGPFRALLVDIHVGRDLTVILFKNPTFHGPVIIRRYPALINDDRDALLYTALSTIISKVVFNMRTVPQSMMVKTFLVENNEEIDWMPALNDELGEAIVKGLFARRSTFGFGMGEFSVFLEDAHYRGWHFKPPRYYNNIFSLPDRRRR